ncbi:MAG: zinc ribbon domain-containing protein [Candidatus Thorarchaeota archaeon]
MVRTCEKCGKANQPTRKFCIRCGASLIKKEVPKEKAPLPATTAPAAPETPAPQPPPAPTPASSDDQWVKPSSVSTDRVRSAGGLTKPKSEFEKAKEAFAKAETVGIEEADGSGVIETRMLRASEVKELLEGPGMMGGGDVPPPTMMEGSEPLPPEAAEFMPQSGPTASQIEESILGSKSAYVDKPPEPEPEPEPVVSASQYEMEDDTPILEATTIETPTETTPSETGFAAAETPTHPEPAPTPAAAAPPPAAPAPAAPAKTPNKVDEDLDLVIACPDCGKVINVDMFEYPDEVYSKMGESRLKQARFMVVQGKPDQAMVAVRKARAFFEKADDKKGLKEVLKLVESLAKAS